MIMVLKFTKKYVTIKQIFESVKKEKVVKKEKNNEKEVSVNNQEVAAEDIIEQSTSKVENKITKVGSLLKEMRLQKGLRIPDVAKKLCIRRIYLEAIEESNYAEIPPFPYGVGFVRSYAAYLGLNSGNIVELYKDEITPKSDKDIFVLEPQSEASVPNKKYLLISLLALALVYGGWSAYNNIETEEQEPAEIEQMSEVNATEELPIVVEDFSAEAIMENSESVETVVAEPQIVMTEASFTETSAEEVKSEVAETSEADANEVRKSGVVINAKEETWIEVKDADKLYISKVLAPGATYNVPEGKGMILSVGKVNGVDVVINGVVTPVVKANKKTNIALDPYINGNH